MCLQNSAGQIFNMYIFYKAYKNSVDRDQLASQKQSDLDQHCFKINSGLAWKALTSFDNRFASTFNP